MISSLSTISRSSLGTRVPAVSRRYPPGASICKEVSDGDTVLPRASRRRSIQREVDHLTSVLDMGRNSISAIGPDLTEMVASPVLPPSSLTTNRYTHVVLL